MPGETVGELVGSLLRILARVIVEGVLEFLVQGTGRVVLRLLRPKREPSEAAAMVAGLIVWAAALAFAITIWLYPHSA
jgi:hypothetical protein